MISAIVLAAGESRRAGAANKLLLPLGGIPLIDHVVQTVRRADVGEVIVVVGHEADRVQAALAHHPVVFAHNDRYALGMTTSIQAGVRAASAQTQGFLICLSDLPLIEPADLNRLTAAFAEAAPAAPIVVPVFEGQRGNPVLFAAPYRDALLAHPDLRGCKGLVRHHADAVVEVAMDTDHVLRDIDTMAAYEALQARLRSAPQKRRSGS